MRPSFLTETWEKLLALAPGKKIFAVEMAGTELRAAVLARRGTKILILDFASMRQAEDTDGLPEVSSLRALGERLNCPSGNAVLASPLVRTFELLMDKEKIQKLNQYQLKESVKWEVEPYTGINGATALLGVEPEVKPKPKPGEIVEEEFAEQTMVNVTAIERNVYRALRERFKAAGFRLTRMYPPEACFYIPVLTDGRDTPRAILEIGQDYSNFAVLKSSVPEQINTISISVESLKVHLSGELPSQDLEDTLRFTVRQVPDPEPLLLTGAGVLHTEIVQFVSEVCPYRAKPLSLSRQAGVADAHTEPTNAVFATVAGAGMRELFRGQKQFIGVNDQIPTSIRIRRSAYLVPVATTVFLFLLLGLHFQYMKFQEHRYKARTAELSETLSERKKEIANYEAALIKQRKLRDEVDLARRRVAYMETEADKHLELLLECLQDLGGSLPEMVVLTSVTQNSETTYSVTGNAYDLPALGAFATKLQESPWCAAVQLEKIASGAKKKNLDFALVISIKRKFL